MKLIKLENETEKLYFTSLLRASYYLQCSTGNLYAAQTGKTKTAKGYTVTQVDTENERVNVEDIDPEHKQIYLI